MLDALEKNGSREALKLVGVREANAEVRVR